MGDASAVTTGEGVFLGSFASINLLITIVPETMVTKSRLEKIKKLLFTNVLYVIFS